MTHHPLCDFWTDQYPIDCTCGATRPRVPGFDAMVVRTLALHDSYGYRTWLHAALDSYPGDP